MCGQMFAKKPVDWSRSLLRDQGRHFATDDSAAYMVGAELLQWALVK